MTLKEARGMAKRFHKIIGLEFWEDEAQAIDILDNRITELEDCLTELRRAILNEYGGRRKHSVNVQNALEKPRQILEKI